MKNNLVLKQAPFVHSAKISQWHIAVFMAFISVPTTHWAQTGELLTNSSINRQSAAATSGEVIPLVPFRYIPPVGLSKNQPLPSTIERSPAQQRIIDFNTAGNYQAVGTEGLLLMSKEKLDDELQLIVANSLAWTGRTAQAIPTYQGLAQGKYANEANIGLANVFRWSGRDDQAAPLYSAVLLTDPENKDAAEGLALTSRELVPRTTLSFGGSIDSSDIRRRSATINHRWRDSTGTNIMEIETSAVKDNLPVFQAQQRDITFRYQAIAMTLKPSVEISAASKASGGIYGSGRITLLDDQLSLQAGRINWGKLATNPNGLAANLSAWQAGFAWNQSLSIGKLSARANYYNISDGNVIVASSARLESSWRPLGRHVLPFLGVETRNAKLSTSNYWSPEQGYGTAYAGVLTEWDSPDWNFYASAQTGVRLYGEAGKSWNILAGGKRWITPDISVGLNAGTLSSKRNSTEYRAKSASVTVEKIWK